MSKRRESAVTKEVLKKDPEVQNGPEVQGETGPAEMEIALEPGAQIEKTRSDGGTDNETFVGSFENDNGYTLVLAREGEGGHLLRSVNSKEFKQSGRAEKQLELYFGAAKSATESAIKAAGLKGAAAQEARAMLAKETPKIVALAMGEKDPEKALTGTVQEVAQAIASGETERPKSNLETLIAQLAQARQKVDSAKTDKEYKAALVEIYAAERAVYTARVELHPDAEPAEKAKIADETDGAVEIIPDSLYDKGADAVSKRIKELEAAMREADRNKDGVSWTVSRNEYDRHRVVMPILEKADAIVKVQAEVDSAIAETKLGHEKSVKSRKAKAEKNRLLWTDLAEKNSNLIKQIEDGLRELDKKPATKEAETEHAKLMADREKKRTILESAQKMAEGITKGIADLEKSGVVLNFDPNEKPATAKTALFEQLRDLYAQNPDRVLEVIKGMFEKETKSKISESTKYILDEWMNYITTELQSETKPKEPIEVVAEEDILPEEPEEQKIEVDVQDLIKAGIVKNSEDLFTWEHSFDELRTALIARKLDLKDEGLPASFEEMLDVKDSRGAFGKLFGTKTDRVKLFNKLAKAHHKYIESI
ncbi:hypothetical protein HY771_00695 [Candidatus Uhrbacteria bacterium]|nr:hypothetical protein [Candidatus Uhrbacteria bacterium]